MGYRITYGQEPKVKRRTMCRRRIWLCAGAVLILSVCICAAQPEIQEMVRQLLFPLTDEATVAAFQEMVRQVGEGTSVGDAVFSFCREIIENAY